MSKLTEALKKAKERHKKMAYAEDKDKYCLKTAQVYRGLLTQFGISPADIKAIEGSVVMK